MSAGSEVEGPLGVTLNSEGATVRVFSAAADEIFICLYNDKGEAEVQRLPLERRADDLFVGMVPGMRDGARYGLRAAGAFDPSRGLRFDPAKLLADPFAMAIDRPFKLHSSMFGFGEDSGPFAPKCVAQRSPSPATPGAHRIAPSETILYELNLRGFTRLNMAIPEEDRGTFAGLAHTSAVEHLVGLRVTSVEIMPADAFVDERHLPPLGLTNAWGYNPVILGAPDPRLAPGGWADVRRATDALHAAGIEVILDIVLNHSGESDEFGPTLSMRGLDNATYYRLLPNDQARYINDMGCGNCLALDRPPVMRLAIEALRRWMLFGGVDGFRFDLATAIGRRSWGFDADAPLFQLIAADDVLKHAKLIAEPWDIGPGGYQVGKFPPKWSEWNDRFRDDVRRFWRGDSGLRGALATRFAGSSDLFAKEWSPSKGVNFVVAHDGFTLADLVSYEHKRNDANGEANRDGANENYSWNDGVEGQTDDPAILAARRRDIQNLLATLLLSRGTPMLAMGAETGHSQNGNNNAYAQDNAISWIDWSKTDKALLTFATKLIALRRSHPALRQDQWLTGRAVDSSGVPDVEWRDALGPLASAAQWEDAQAHVLVIVLSEVEAGVVKRLLVAFNGGGGESEIHLPEPRERQEWRVVADTGASDSTAERLASADERILAAPRSCVVLVEEEAPANRRSTAVASADLIDRLAAASGIAADWWDVGGSHTIVSAQTKLALLAGMRMPARLRDDARESLRRLVDLRDARRLPCSLLGYQGEPLSAPLRAHADGREGPIDLRVETEDGQFIEWRADDGAWDGRTLLDGRLIKERPIDLPLLPQGRHRLLVGDVACNLTIAPRAAYLAPGAARKRFGFSAQLYSQRREGTSANFDQGIGDFTTLGVLGETLGRSGAALLGINPLHALYPYNRERVSPYHPSDRRFLDPINIDVFDGEGLPTDDTLKAALSAGLAGIGVVANMPTVDYVNVWRLKRVLLQARWMAFERGRIVRPSDQIFTDFNAFVREGGESLHHFVTFQAIAQSRGGEDWRAWPAELRDRDPAALDAKAKEFADEVSFGLFTQWLAERQLAKAAERARQGGLELGLYRDLAVGSAPDGAEAWGRWDELISGVSVGAPPDPFSASGQVWHLPPPDPLAGARDGWRGLAALYGANMRHAGLLRLDHAMGLARLFVIPDGARPAQGAYVAYPLHELVANLALESHRRNCMVVGEDLGTVPEGLRDTLTAANIFGMRVLWFEKNGGKFLPPPDYPSLAVACASTHDLPTLAGWWNGFDIAEQMTLARISLEDAQHRLSERAAEKLALVEALREAGLLDFDVDMIAPVTDAFAAAVHAWLATAGSMLATAQVDDLAGEKVGTNLPGTDRERPNWRHRLQRSVESLMTTDHARSIVEALAAVRR